MKSSRIVLALVTSLIVLSPTAQATIISYTANLSGLNEFPSNLSPATGFATVTVDDVLNTMAVNFTFTGLTGTATAAHIHCCTALPLTGNVNVATTMGAGFPIGASTGAFNNTFDMTQAASFNAGFVASHGGTVDSARNALFSGIASDKSYLNIHTNIFPGGEIRGFLAKVSAPVPEPATLALFGLGLAGLGWFRRSKSG